MFRILDYFDAEPRDAWDFFVSDKGDSLRASLLVVATLFAFQLSVALRGFLLWIQN
jgi:hypothetical protein